MLTDYAIAAKGMVVQLARHEVLANNVANGSTAGFMRDTLVVEARPSWPGGRGLPVPEIAGVVAETASGELRQTGNPLDLALRGDAFFLVETPQGSRLTRAGSLSVDAEGALRTTSGFPLLGQGGPIQGVTGPIEVSASGDLIANGEIVDRLVLQTVEAGAVLTKTPDGFVWPAQGEDVLIDAQDYEVLQGYLEGSAVNPVREMVEMVTAYRAYEAGVQSLKALDRALGQATERLGRLSVGA